MVVVADFWMRSCERGVKEITHDLNHDLNPAHPINCVYDNSVRSMFRVLVIYNFAKCNVFAMVNFSNFAQIISDNFDMFVYTMRTKLVVRVLP